MILHPFVSMNWFVSFIKTIFNNSSLANMSFEKMKVHNSAQESTEVKIPEEYSVIA